MSDIFYSEVNPSVQAELNARGLSGKRRTTADLNFMLGKIANVKIQAWGKSSSEDTYQLVPESILNGDRVRSGEFLPGGKNGFLNDRPYQRIERVSDEEIDYYSNLNKTKRLPPFITAVDINVTDHSIGLLNSCTFNILVSNPEQDLEYIESMYCRPGRPVNVHVEYPDSAVLNGNSLLASSSMASLSALKTDQVPESQYLNKTKFQGLIINFSIDYQTDMTCVVNVILRGTTNVFTDVTAIVDSATTKDVKTDNSPITGAISIFDGIQKEFDSVIDKTKEKAAHEKVTDTTPNGEAYVIEYKNGNKIYYGLTGKEQQIYKFISLGWLIDYINRNILSKIQDSIIISPEIILDDSISKSNIEPITNIQSCDPYTIFLPFSIIEKPETGTPYPNVYGTYQYFPQSIVDISDGVVKSAESNSSTTRSLTANGLENIMISLTEIESVYKDLNDSTKNLVKLNQFLDVIFAKIKNKTGNFIDLHLITHPDDQSKLLLYNISYKTGKTTEIKPYSIPMFANHNYGTVITDFKFSGQLPTDSANLAFAINDLDSDTTTSDIAPFLNFMYSSNTLSRSRQPDANGIDTIRDQSNPLITLDEMEDRYNKKRFEALTKWRKAKENYIKSTDNQKYKDEMYNSLKEWVTYQNESFKENYQVKNPVIPFEVEFTLDGINGFKWGDVLTFDALPSRYKRNCVFSIISITHNVTDTGEWKTNIKCITRAQIND
jgi:hypothetical protein